MYQEISVIDDSEQLTEKLKKIFDNEKDYLFKNIKTSSIEETIKDIPDLIIINEDSIINSAIELCNYIRNYNDNF